MVGAEGLAGKCGFPWRGPGRRLLRVGIMAPNQASFLMFRQVTLLEGTEQTRSSSFSLSYHQSVSAIFQRELPTSHVLV